MKMVLMLNMMHVEPANSLIKVVLMNLWTCSGVYVRLEKFVWAALNVPSL